MRNWMSLVVGALAGLGMAAAVHAYGPGNPAKLNAVPPGFVECAVDGGVCKVPAGATGYVVYGTGNTFATAQGTGDFTCLPKGWVKQPTAAKPQDLGVDDPVPNVQKKCYLQAAPQAPGFSGKGPAGCTDKRCWLEAVDKAQKACAASGCSSCTPNTTASDNCKFENGYTCTSFCKAAAKAAPPPPAPAPAPQPVAAPPKPTQGIMVKQAVYGGNCVGKGRPDPNIKGTDPTQHIAAACNGKSDCSYKVDHTAIGDPTFGCAKDYKVEYACAGGAPGKAEASPEASGKMVALKCAAAPAPSAPPAPAAPQGKMACYWMSNTPGNPWVPSPMPAPDQAACKRLDSCSPDGGKASGGGCYVWASEDQVKGENAKKTAPQQPAKAAAGDQCAPMIPNNAGAAGVCGPVCAKVGLQFAGNWSNDRRHPPVAACSQQGKGQSVCGCK